MAQPLFTVANRPPGVSVVDAVHVHGYCLTLDGSRLTEMNRVCVEAAATFARLGLSKHVLISGCYQDPDCAKELSLRREILHRSGVDDSRIHDIRGITSTADELGKLSEILMQLEAKSLLIVANDYHMPRALKGTRKKFPNLTLYWQSVPCSRYEFMREPNPIKVLRSGIGLLWMLWNVLLYPLT